MLKSEKNSIPEDSILIEKALAGDKKSLEWLIKRYQDFIYNVSLRLFLDPEDALDATQEVLIKIITALKTFKGESKFSTWVYRIAFNHFLNSSARKMETRFESDPDSFAHLNSEESHTEVNEQEVEEVRIMCSTAMLMCLNREQRLIYIIGEIFGADHQLGAELFDTTPVNFRVKLHRAKADMLSFVSGKCGLVNPANSCRCNKKARQMVDKGIVNKHKMIFNADYKDKIHDIVINRKDEVSDHIKVNLKEYFQNSPFQIKTELDNLLEKII